MGIVCVEFFVCFVCFLDWCFMSFLGPQISTLNLLCMRCRELFLSSLSWEPGLRNYCLNGLIIRDWNKYCQTCTVQWLHIIMPPCCLNILQLVMKFYNKVVLIHANAASYDSNLRPVQSSCLIQCSSFIKSISSWLIADSLQCTEAYLTVFASLYVQANCIDWAVVGMCTYVSTYHVPKCETQEHEILYLTEFYLI